MDIFASLDGKDDNKAYQFHISHITPSFFIDGCINKYLSGPIPKYSLPKKSTDKVELEPIPSSFLPPLFPYLPKLFYLPEDKIYAQRIVGYREIFSKRLRIEYLKLVENDEIIILQKKNVDEGTNIYWIPEAAPGGGKGPGDGPPPVEEEEEDEEVELTEEDYLNYEDDDDYEYDEEYEEPEPEPEPDFVQPQKIEPQKLQPQKLQPQKMQPQKQEPRKLEPQKIQAKKLEKRTTIDMETISPKILTPKQEAQRRRETQTEEIERKAEEMQKAKIERELDYFRANEVKMQRIVEEFSRGNSTLPSVVGSTAPVRKKITLKAAAKKKVVTKTKKAPKKRYKYVEPQLDLEDVDSKDHLKAAYILKHEKDYEWLELSESNDENIIESLTKPHMPWMVKKIAHESQLLQRHLNLFYKCSKYLGRSFYHLRINTQTRQIEYVVKKKKEIVFAITTALIWIPLCLMIQSFLDIRFLKKDKGTYWEAEFVLLEKYGILLCAIMSNMLVVGVWSVLVILQDSLVITHYLNCWNLALNEMETSAVSNIHKITIINLVYFAIFCSIIAICFYFDKPESVRGTAGLISALICRGVVSDIFLKKPNVIIYYQIFGALFYIYCAYGCRCLHMLMQIVATIIRNASEMWNLKFGLTFSQFLIKDRGQLTHIRLNHSLVKTFTHHRLICGLVNIYGEAFAWPIVIFITVQMAVFLMVITNSVFILSQSSDEEHEEYVVVHSTDSLGTSLSHRQVTLHNFTRHQHSSHKIATMIFVVIYMMSDFLLTTEIIAKAGQSFIDGFEFVRRQNVILCTNSHQRRLLQSLEWSMSAASPNVLSVKQFFTLHRSVIFSAVTSSFVYFSLIIQIKTQKQLPYFYVLTQNCSPTEPEVNRQGFCLHKILIPHHEGHDHTHK